MKNLSNQQKGSLLAFIAVFFITPDSLFIRLSTIETWGMLFYRGAIPFIVVLTGLLIFYKKNFFKVLFSMGMHGVFYALIFAITNITFIVSIQNTNVANTLVMIAMAPMLSAILGGIFLKELPDKKTWTAILITFVASFYIFFARVSPLHGHVKGWFWGSRPDPNFENFARNPKSQNGPKWSQEASPAPEKIPKIIYFELSPP